jgi:acyl-CoA thioester hydrolase
MMQGMAAFVWTTRVRYVDTDTSGRIHYTALFRFFEAAEQEFLRSVGHNYPGLAGGDQGFPRVHAECDISGALVFDDEIHVHVSVARVGNSSFDLGFHVTKDALQCAKGRVVIVFMNRVTQRAQPLPEALATTLRDQMEPVQ